MNKEEIGRLQNEAIDNGQQRGIGLIWFQVKCQENAENRIK